MESLIYFGLWAGLIFLMMRFGCGAHVLGHGHPGARSKGHDGAAEGDGKPWIAPTKATDPVCGKGVSTERAKPSVFEGEVYYFCSRECREVFEAAPDLYVSEKRRQGGQLLEHSHG